MAWRPTAEPVAFIFFVCIYIEYIVLQDFLYNKFCLEITNSTGNVCNRTQASEDEAVQISKIHSLYISVYMGIFCLCSFIACLFTGSWSDSFGRRPFMALPSILGIISEVIFIICSLHLTSSAVIPLVMVAAFFNGISGGSSTVLASCFGYITDITQPNGRIRRFSFLEAAFFIGGFVGSSITSLILKKLPHHLFTLGVFASPVVVTPHVLSFCICIALHVALLIYVWVLAETQRPLSRSPTDSHIRLMAKTIFHNRPTRKLIILLCILAMCNTCALSPSLTLTFPLLKQPPLNWDSSQYGLYNGLQFLTCGISLILLLPLMQRLIPQISDSAVGFLGFMSKGLGLLNLSLARNTLQVYLGIVLYLFADFSMPAIRALMARAVTQNERGKAFAFLGAVQNVAQFACSFLFPALFRVAPDSLPGLPFVIASVIQFAACGILLFLKRPAHLTEITSGE